VATKRNAFEGIHEELDVMRRALGATRHAFGPVEALAKALLTDCRHGATCLPCLHERTEALLDSLVTLGTIAEEERGVRNGFRAFKRFVNYLQVEKELIRRSTASQARAVSNRITAALPYVRRVDTRTPPQDLGAAPV